MIPDLAAILPAEAILEPQGRYLADLMGRGVQGTADAVVLPSTTEEVAAELSKCPGPAYASASVIDVRPIAESRDELDI